MICRSGTLRSRGKYRKLPEVSVGYLSCLPIEEVHASGSAHADIESVVKYERQVFSACFPNRDAFTNDMKQSEIDQLQDLLVRGVVGSDLNKQSIFFLLLHTEISYFLKQLL